MMQTIIFKERENGSCEYIGWSGTDRGFIPMEVDMNENSYLDDMVVYLYCDVTGKPVDEVFEEYEENGYDVEVYEDELRRLNIDYIYLDREIEYLVKYVPIAGHPRNIIILRGYHDFTSTVAVNVIQTIINGLSDEDLQFTADDIRTLVTARILKLDNGASLRIEELEAFNVDEVQD